MAKGGKRDGAGRPKGTTNKPQLKDYFTEKEIKEIIRHTKQRFLENDKVLVHVIEQIFGKAQQNVDITSGGQSFVDDELKRKADAAIAAYLHGGKH